MIPAVGSRSNGWISFHPPLPPNPPPRIRAVSTPFPARPSSPTIVPLAPRPCHVPHPTPDVALRHPPPPPSAPLFGPPHTLPPGWFAAPLPALFCQATLDHSGRIRKGREEARDDRRRSSSWLVAGGNVYKVGRSGWQGRKGEEEGREAMARRRWHWPVASLASSRLLAARSPVVGCRDKTGWENRVAGKTGERISAGVVL